MPLRLEYFDHVVLIGERRSVDEGISPSHFSKYGAVAHGEAPRLPELRGSGNLSDAGYCRVGTPQWVRQQLVQCLRSARARIVLNGMVTHKSCGAAAASNAD
jgi:hypothetical protein